MKKIPKETTRLNIRTETKMIHSVKGGIVFSALLNHPKYSHYVCRIWYYWPGGPLEYNISYYKICEGGGGESQFSMTFN